MSQDIHSINHVGIAVHSMEEGERRFVAMGFVLTPFSTHSGAWKSGEPLERLGWGNRCIMFGHNYLEILASIDPANVPERIASFLSRFQGAHIICFGTENAHAVEARLRAAGVKTSGVIPLQRDVDTPEGVRTAKFQRLQIAPDASPEGYIQAARHLTPGYIHQAPYMTHPNGATALSEVFLLTDDPDGFERKYAAYVGASAAREGAKRIFRFSLVSSLSIFASADVVAALPGSLLPPIPGIAGVSFRLPSLAAQRVRLAQAGIRHLEREGRIIVPAEEALGTAVVFHE